MIQKKIIIFVIMILFVFPRSIFAEQPTTEQEINRFIQDLIDSRNQFLTNPKVDTISRFYTNTIKTSRYGLQMEKRRTQYINTWADLRGIRIFKAKSKILGLKIRISGNEAKVFFRNSMQMEYGYPHKQALLQRFGISTRHSLTLKKINNQWVVLKEWYSDPMEENPKNVPVDLATPAYLPLMEHAITTPPKSSKTRRYNREKAVAYADKYAGEAWGAGNNNHYNAKYYDYHYQGGDCTNYASQVLGDPSEGGGLKMTPQWRGSKQGGTMAWVQTDAFKKFITYSGYGYVIAQGTYPQVTSPTPRFPKGAISQLQPGDLIGYILKGIDIDHFCVVVGKDVNGYVLVNSHSGDRFHVPWDIGWDKYTKFVLVHINN